MLLVAPVHIDKLKPMTDDEKLNVVRNETPAVTHVDHSDRVQSLTEGRYYRLVKEFEKQTSCLVVVNTLFNVHGEPIVCTTEDSYRCFIRTKMDILVIEDFILYNTNQLNFKDLKNWQDEFELD